MRALSVIFAISLFSSSAAIAKEPKAAAPPPAVKQEFEEFIGRFRGAVKANDGAAVAALTRLPYQGDESIRTADQFHAKIYKSHFTAKTRVCIQAGNALYDRDGENNDAYSIFCGDDIFVFTKTPVGFLLTDITLND